MRPSKFTLILKNTEHLSYIFKLLLKKTKIKSIKIIENKCKNKTKHV